MTVRTVALSSALALALSGCGGGTTTNPPPAYSNISGDYTGTVQSSGGGTLTATATLAQHGNAAGGALSTTAGSTTLVAAISLVITTSNALSGTIVQDLPDGTTCTFSTSGTYNTGSQAISGSYTAVTGCSGENGTYTLTQQCTDTVTSLERRAMGIPKC